MHSSSQQDLNVSHNINKHRKRNCFPWSRSPGKGGTTGTRRTSHWWWKRRRWKGRVIKTEVKQEWTDSTGHSLDTERFALCPNKISGCTDAKCSTSWVFSPWNSTDIKSLCLQGLCCLIDEASQSFKTEINQSISLFNFHLYLKNHTQRSPKILQSWSFDRFTEITNWGWEV